MAVSLPLAPLPSPTSCKSPAGSPATLSFPVLCGEAYILHMRHISDHISHIYACFQVQTHCPFNIIEDEPSMASGDPTFLCRGPSSTFCSFFIFFIKRFFLQNSFPFHPFLKDFVAKFISLHCSPLCWRMQNVCLCKEHQVGPSWERVARVKWE